MCKFLAHDGAIISTMQRSACVLGGVILTMLILTGLIWYGVWKEDQRGLLTVSFLNVGQGDSIFIRAPGGTKVLIDGGPADGGLMRRLGEMLPWWDRSIDLVIPTHPDADHIAGLITVFRRYRVSHIVQSSVLGSTPTWDTLEKEIANEKLHGAQVLTAQRGQTIDLGKGARLEVLSPDRNVPGVDTNAGCVATRLVYGKTAFMFGCDAPQAVEKYLVSLDGAALHANVLKAGHHGSRTSSAPLWVGEVNPQYVVYSRGCNNTYGFPHAETVATYARFGIPTLDTCESGTISFESDGATVRRK